MSDSLDDILDDVSKKRVGVPSDHAHKKPVSKSQDLRFVLYHRWQNEAVAKMPFQAFYEREMDIIIDEQRKKSVPF